MKDVRTVLSRRPGLFALVLGLALLMKAWVPIGYMPVAAGGSLMVLPCSGHGVMDMPGMASMDMGSMGAMDMGSMGAMDHAMMHGDMGQHGDAQHGDEGSQFNMTCAFSGLTAPSATGALPQLLAAALAFLFVLALVARVQAPLQRKAFLRPPTQAPPILG